LGEGICINFIFNLFLKVIMPRSSIKHLVLKTSQKNASVPIFIGKGIVSHIHSLLELKSFSRVAIVTDTNINKHWGKTLQKTFGKNDILITIPPGEEQKNLATVQNIWATMLLHNLDRKSLLICVGGGVICDVGAFAASTYMRGIQFVQIPTTLLAQTDAAIGGKTGVNFGELKNMIGTFAQPLAIISDTKFLSTLPEREYLSGFAEVIKHSLIAGSKLFKQLSGKNLAKLSEKELEDVLFKSSQIKYNLVTADPLEKRERKILNFGHTIGHAIEMASHETTKPLLHGEAVAIGMIGEAKLSQLAGMINNKEFESIERLIKKTKLPIKVDRKLKNTILKKIVSDKKNEKQKIKWVLLDGIGKAAIDIEQRTRLINQAIDYILE
jgi:3-dehydroquinate synthase